jgi:hypothetical protein
VPYAMFWSDNLNVKRPLGSPRCRCEDNIVMDLMEIECDCLDLVHVAYDLWRVVVTTVMNLEVP